MAHTHRAGALHQIRVRRLKFMSWGLLSGPPALITMFDASLHLSHSLASYFVQDLEWLSAHMKRSAELPSPSVDLRPWLKLSLSSKWRSLVNYASRDTMSMYVDDCKLKLMHHNVLKSLTVSKVSAVPPFCGAPLSHAAPVDLPTSGFICHECSHVAKTKIGWHNTGAPNTW